MDFAGKNFYFTFEMSFNGKIKLINSHETIPHYPVTPSPSVKLYYNVTQIYQPYRRFLFTGVRIKKLQKDGIRQRAGSGR